MPIQGVREIVLKFTGDTKDLKNASSTGQKQVSSWRDSFKKLNRAAVAGSLAVVAGFGKMAKDSVALSRRMAELDTKAKAVFEDQLAPMQKWADENKKAFGLSQRETLALGASFADLLKPMGFTAEQAAEMSTEVLDLSGALAKWSGGQYDAAQVSEILSKAMLGEREQLKSLGISITEADVKARLAKNGQEELTGAALQQAKAIATQELIMEKSTDAQKAWADGGRDAAEAENAMGVAVTELQEKLASTLAPAIVKGTELLAAFAGWAERNDDTVIKLGAAILGLAGFVLTANAAYKVYLATTKAVILATKAWTVAQKALNLVLRANPIGIVITILAALGAALIAAYKKSETFRNIVDGAMRGVRRAFGFVLDKGRDVLGWFRALPGKIKGFMSGVADVITAPYRKGFEGIRAAWNNTVGGKGFSVPDWVPKIGGREFRIPRLHQGTRNFQPPAGLEEGLAILRRGEQVITPGERGGRGGGDTYNINVQAWSDRFSLPQIKRELRNHGVA